MEDAEEALLVGNSIDLITHLRDIDKVEDFRSLINQAIDLGDFNALWYIAEVGSYYDENIDSYILNQCGINGQTIPCIFLQSRGDPMMVLEDAVINGDEDSLLYAIDLLYNPVNPSNFIGYSSQEYKRILVRSHNIDRRVEEILLQASPSFLKRIFSRLPRRLQVNLHMLTLH
jgi:hypothetical protein